MQFQITKTEQTLIISWSKKYLKWSMAIRLLAFIVSICIIVTYFFFVGKNYDLLSTIVFSLPSIFFLLSIWRGRQRLNTGRIFTFNLEKNQVVFNGNILVKTSMIDRVEYLDDNILHEHSCYSLKIHTKSDREFEISSTGQIFDNDHEELAKVLADFLSVELHITDPLSFISKKTIIKPILTNHKKNP